MQHQGSSLMAEAWQPIRTVRILSPEPTPAQKCPMVRHRNPRIPPTRHLWAIYGLTLMGARSPQQAAWLKAGRNRHLIRRLQWRSTQTEITPETAPANAEHRQAKWRIPNSQTNKHGSSATSGSQRERSCAIRMGCEARGDINGSFQVSAGAARHTNAQNASLTGCQGTTYWHALHEHSPPKPIRRRRRDGALVTVRLTRLRRYAEMSLPPCRAVRCQRQRKATHPSVHFPLHY